MNRSCAVRRSSVVLSSGAYRRVGPQGRIETKNCIGEILPTLARDPAVEAMVRVDAAGALGELGRADEAADAWLALARDEMVGAEVREWAAEALGRLERVTPEVLAGLRALAEESGTPERVRRAARKVLEQLGG